MENPKTGELMSKSKGTGVFLGVGADKMFEDIMRQPDEMIEVLLVNNTRIPLEDIAKMDIENKPLWRTIWLQRGFNRTKTIRRTKQSKSRRNFKKV